jgi:cytochrome P450
VKKLGAVKGPTDVQALLLEHAMRTSSEFLGLAEIDAASTDEEWYAAFDALETGIMTRLVLNDFYWLYDTRAFRAACQRVRAVVNDSVRQAMNIPVHDAASQSKEKRNLLEELVLHTRDDDRLSTMILDLLFAGRQTTTSFISSTLYYLARHSSVYAKLREHVLRDFGPVATDRLISFEELKNCKYLQYCLNEALRLMPAAPFGAMTAIEDTTIPRGGGSDGEDPVYIPKVRFEYMFLTFTTLISTGCQRPLELLRPTPRSRLLGFQC